MSYYPNTPRPMQFCAALTTTMPVYESTGLETKYGCRREAWTQCLCDMTGVIYMGCFSIGEPFRISCLALLNVCTNLLVNDDVTIKRLRKYYPTLDPLKVVAWLDKLLDDHENQREIEFKWM